MALYQLTFFILFCLGVTLVHASNPSTLHQSLKLDCMDTPLGCPARQKRTTFYPIPSEEEFIFILQNGTGISPLNYTDLIPYLPHVDHVNSVEFLNWLEDKEKSERSLIVKSIEFLQIEGDVKEAVAKLILFTNAESNVMTTMALLPKIADGSFLRLYLSLPPAERKKISITKKLFLESMMAAAFSRAFGSNNTRSMEDLGWSMDDYLLQLNFMLEGLMEGDPWDIAALTIMTLSLGGDIGSELYELMSDAGKFGGVFDAIGVFGDIASLFLDIAALVTGNLQGIDLAIAIVSIVSDVIGLAITIASLAITAFAAVAGPIGLIVGAIFALIEFFLGDIKKRNAATAAVSRLHSSIYLTQAEKDREWQRNYDELEYSQYLVDLANQKYGNNLLADELAKSLVKMTNVRMYIHPALDGRDPPQFYEDNSAELTYQRTFQIARWSPDQSAIPSCCPLTFRNQIGCFPTDEGDGTDSEYSYQCSYAIGVNGVTGDMSLRTMNVFDLKNGTDTAYGSDYQENVFMVDLGHKIFQGGALADTFVVRGQSGSGSLRGGGGSNVLVLDESLDSGTSVIDLPGKSLRVAGRSMEISEMRVISGRPGLQDFIHVDCDTLSVDGKGGVGGVLSAPDSIIIEEACEHETFILVGGSHDVRIGGGVSGSVLFNVSQDVWLELELDSSLKADVALLFDFELNDIITGQFVGPENKIYISLIGGGQVNTQVIFPEGRSSRPFIRTKNEVVFMADESSGVMTASFNVTDENVGGYPVYDSELRGLYWTQNNIIVDTPLIDKVTCGPYNDTVVLKSSLFKGSIHGMKGQNLLFIDPKFHSDSVVTLDMTSGSVSTQTEENLIYFEGFERVMGRQNLSDIIKADCMTSYIDGQGSLEGVGDIIQIRDDPTCSKNESWTPLLYISARENTLIQNEAGSNWTFVYAVDLARDIEFDLNFNDNATHIVRFSASIVDLKDASLSDTNDTVSFSGADAVIQIPLKGLDQDYMDSLDQISFESPHFITNNSQPVSIMVTNHRNFYAIFNITKPEVTLQGSSFATNLFFLNSTVDTVKGGQLENMYEIIDSQFSGIISGQEGHDRVTLTKDYRPGEIVHVNLDEKTESGQISYVKIEEFVGRASDPEVITASCLTEIVDGLGGTGTTSDVIQLNENKDCDYQLRIMVHNFTSIDNQARSGQILYNIMDNGDNDLITGVSQLVNITINHNWSQQSLIRVDLINNTNNWSLQFENEQGHTRTFTLDSSDSQNESKFVDRPRIFSSDLIEFKASRKEGHVHAIFTVKVEQLNSTKGFDYLRNIFVCTSTGSSEVNQDLEVTGGPLDDTFIIANSSFSAHLNGLEGNDTLLVNDNLVGALNFQSGPPTVNDRDPGLMTFENLEYIYGRPDERETVIVDCNVKMVDLKGGSTDPDRILVPDSPNCPYGLNIGVRGGLIVENMATNGSFFYSFHEDLTQFEVICLNCTMSKHTFALPYNFTDISSIKVDNQTKIINIIKNDGQRNYSLSGLHFLGYPRLLTSDLVQLDLSHLGMRAMVRSSESRDQIIPYWQDVALKMNLSVTILSTDDSTGEVTHIKIGRSGRDLLQSSPNHANILIGNGGSNVYTIGKGEVDLNELNPEIVIISQGNSSDLIDLTQLIRPIREKIDLNETAINKTLYVPTVQYLDRDMVILIEEKEVNRMERPIRIVIRDWTSWYLGLKIILHQGHMDLKFLDGEWSLEPTPLVIDHPHAVLDQSAFEDNSVILIQRNMSSNPNNSVVTSGGSLVVTNVFNANATTDDMFSLVFRDFREANQKAGGVLPRNVDIKFANEAILKLDEISLGVLKPIEEVIVEEEVAADLEIWGFRCTAAGTFPDPRFCDVYHVCEIVGDEFGHSEFECPLGTVFCHDLKLCSYPGTCADCNDQRYGSSYSL